MARFPTVRFPHLCPQRIARPALLAILALFLAPGCDSKPATPPDPRAKPGHLIGRLADSQGKPLSNVTVRIYGFNSNNEPVDKQVKIDGPAGEFSIPLPDGAYSTPTATITIDYNERTYTMPLAPADDLREWTDSRDSRKGIVRDFVWKIAGPKPPSFGSPMEPSGYWGAAVNFQVGGNLGEIATIEIVFTPDGPLIDGSQGKPLLAVKKLPWERQEDHYILDLPIGKYTATAKLAFGTKPKPLRLACYAPESLEGSPTQTSTKTTVEFETQENRDGTFTFRVPSLVAYPP